MDDEQDLPSTTFQLFFSQFTRGHHCVQAWLSSRSSISATPTEEGDIGQFSPKTRTPWGQMDVGDEACLAGAGKL